MLFVYGLYMVCMLFKSKLSDLGLKEVDINVSGKCQVINQKNSSGY